MSSSYLRPLGRSCSLGSSRGGIIRTKPHRTTQTLISAGISHHKGSADPLSRPLGRGWGGCRFCTWINNVHTFMCTSAFEPHNSYSIKNALKALCSTRGTCVHARILGAFPKVKAERKPGFLRFAALSLVGATTAVGLYEGLCSNGLKFRRLSVGTADLLIRHWVDLQVEGVFGGSLLEKGSLRLQRLLILTLHLFISFQIPLYYIYLGIFNKILSALSIDLLGFSQKTQR